VTSDKTGTKNNQGTEEAVGQNWNDKIGGRRGGGAPQKQLSKQDSRRQEDNEKVKLRKKTNPGATPTFSDTGKK